MQLYKVQELEQELEAIAEANEGVIPEEKFRELVEAQTKSLESVERMVKFVNHLEYFQDEAKKEIDRIKGQHDKAKNIVENIKKYLIPYVKAQPKGKINVGTFTLGTRKSTKTIVDEEAVPKKWFTKKITRTLDKAGIKKLLSAGKKVKGAYLEENENLSIK